MRPTTAAGWAPPMLVVALAGLTVLAAMRGARVVASRRAMGAAERSRRSAGGPSVRRRHFSARAWEPLRLFRLVPALAGAAIGWVLSGPIGLLVGGAAGVAIPLVRARRKGRGRAETRESDLADLAATISLALRSGLSISQAFEFAGGELRGPTRELFDRFLDERRLGIGFDAALERFGGALGTDDTQLFVLVMSVHARSGGDLAGALDEVSSTIRHRIAVRRELRAASTQGRVSGAILGALPIAFFLVLAATSHRQLGPVYRSAPGIAMISGGLGMEALAYVWIRRLLRIEV